MHWHVLGVGSIGGLWAASLALAGYPVTLLLKDRQTAALFQQTGLRLEADAVVEQPAVEAVAVDQADASIDWLLVTTKTYVTLAALAPLKSRLSSNTKILLLQNGIGVQQQVVHTFSECEVIASITTDGAWRREPFHVVLAGRGHSSFGAVSPVSPETVDELRQCFERLASQTQWVDDIWRPLWRKLAVNCCINALSAVRRCRNGELLESDEAMTMIRGLAAEVQQVMSAAGLGFAFPRLFDEVVDVIEKTAGNYSSMQQDASRGRETEIDCINGYICERAAELGIETPLNRQLVNAIRAL